MATQADGLTSSVPDPLSEEELDRRLDVLGMTGLDRER